MDGYNEMASLFLDNPELARNLLMDKCHSSVRWWTRTN